MGNFYTNIAIKTKNRKAVGPFLSNLKRIAYISPVDSGFIFVYDEKCEQNTKETARLAKKLSKEFDSPVFAIMNHDDDILVYMLFDKGKEIDKYDSAPGYFSGAKKPPQGGNAEKMAAAFSRASEMGRIHEILQRSSGGEGGFMFASDRHCELVAALGLSDHYSLLGYRHIVSGQLPEGVNSEDFLEIGEGPAVQFRKQMAQAAVEKRNLIDQGFLLREIEWPLKTSSFPGVAHWCLIDNPSGLLLAWGNPDPDVKQPLEGYYAPWDKPAEPVPVSFPASVSELQCDPSGRLLAVGNFYGNWMAELWDLSTKELRYRIPHTRVVRDLAFTPDGLFLLSLSQELIFSNVRDGKVEATIPLPSEGIGIVIHPSSRYATLSCGRQLLIVDIHEKQIINVLNCSSVQGPLTLKTMQSRAQTMNVVVQGWETLDALRFDSTGERLFAAASSGAMVYGWNDLLSAKEVTPKPLIGVVQAGTHDRSSAFAYDVDFDQARNWLLFSGINGIVTRFDLKDRHRNTLLTVPGRPIITRLRLSSDRSFLACTCKSMDNRGTSQAFYVQIWDYKALIAASEKVSGT